MISEIAAWIFALFVVNPLHAEISKRFEQANLPVEVLRQSRECIATHGPRLMQRAGEQPGWATGAVIGVATGWTSPIELFEARDPNCSALVRLFDGAIANGTDA